MDNLKTRLLRVWPHPPSQTRCKQAIYIFLLVTAANITRVGFNRGLTWAGGGGGGGGVSVCGDAVLRYFCGKYAEIYILTCGIAVLQDQAVF